MVLLVRELDGGAGLSGLAADAEHDGQGMVARLIVEWNSGANRFDRPGERLYASMADDRVVGVCGLNQDPYANLDEIGRVRRLYVMSDSRRRGVGSALVTRLMSDAASHFQGLHVRTYDAAAGAFYRSCGFTETHGEKYCTHRIELRRAPR